MPNGTPSTRNILFGLPGETGATLGTTSRLAQNVSESTPTQQFSLALMDLLREFQGVGTRPFAEQEFGARELQARRLGERTPQELIGAAPSVQTEVRGAAVGAVQPTITGAQEAGRTFTEQIKGFGDALSQAKNIMAEYESSQQKLREDMKSNIDFILKTSGSSGLESLLKQNPDAFKIAGFDPKTIEGFLPALKIKEQADLEKADLERQKTQAEIEKLQRDARTKLDITEAQEGIFAVDPFTGKAISVKGEGSASFRNNNPGNIKFGPFAKSQGAVDSGEPALDGGTWAKFSTYNQGKEALKSLLRGPSYKDLSMEQAMRRWSGGGYGAEIFPQNVIRGNMKVGGVMKNWSDLVANTIQKREGFIPPPQLTPEKKELIPKPPTEGMRRASSFWIRANDANKVFEEYETVPPRTSLRFLPDFFVSEAGKIFRQAERQFIEAYLRKDSGAAISPNEYTNAKQTYFPQPGDTPPVLERKKQAREAIMEGLKKESGTALDETIEGSEEIELLKVRKKSDGILGRIPPEEFDPTLYDVVQ